VSSPHEYFKNDQYLSFSIRHPYRTLDWDLDFELADCTAMTFKATRLQPCGCCLQNYMHAREREREKRRELG